MSQIDKIILNGVSYELGSGDGLTDQIKQALLQVTSKATYIDEYGQTYYDELETALYSSGPPGSLAYITCVYTQSGTVYDTDTLDSLKSDLVVVAHYDNGNTQTVTTYTLSGTLTAGTSTITVAYSGKTTTFNVTVTTTIIYQLTNKSFNKTDPCVDTEIPIMATDRTFTILMDGIQENSVPTGTNVRLMFCATSSSNWKGIFFGAGSSSSNTYYGIQWMSGDTGNVGFIRTATNVSFKMAYRHIAGSNKTDIFIKIDDNSITTKTLTSNYAASDGNLFIGGGNPSAPSDNWVGTMNLCKIHNVALSDDYINSFMAS